MQVLVRVTTGARRELVKEVAPQRFEIAVREEAERNMANKRVIALVASHFGVGEKAVRILKGHRSPNKTLVVHSILDKS